MAHNPIEEDEDVYEEEVVRRPAGPRFGPFVTIAVAILLLFGAASRVGRPAESGTLLDFDLLASRSLKKEQIKLLEQRNATLVTLGAMPSSQQMLHQPPGSLRMEGEVLPPPRGEIDYSEYRAQHRPPAALSMPIPTEGNNGPEMYIPGGADSKFDPAPEAPHRAAGTGSEKTYVVATGDNWVKIGKATGKKWQDIQKANPQAADGLRVGMRLTIPE